MNKIKKSDIKPGLTFLYHEILFPAFDGQIVTHKEIKEVRTIVRITPKRGHIKYTKNDSKIYTMKPKYIGKYLADSYFYPKMIDDLIEYYKEKLLKYLFEHEEEAVKLTEEIIGDLEEIENLWREMK
jgi:hypothetical protein